MVTFTWEEGPVKGWLGLLGLAAAIAMGSGCGSTGATDAAEAEARTDALPNPVTTDPDRREIRVTRYPIVLMHGINAAPHGESATNLTGFYRVGEALAWDGHEIHETAVPPFEPVSVRARSAYAQIELIVHDWETRHPGRRGRVNLVTHSMGALDAREVIRIDAPRAELQHRPPWVASLTTIAGPHRGSALADKVLSLLPDDPRDPVDRERLETIDALLSWFGRAYSDVSDRANVRLAVKDLTEAEAARFTAEHPVSAAVFVQTFAGVSAPSSGTARNPRDLAECKGRLLGGPEAVDDMSLSMSGLASIVGHGDGPNDGMVEVRSARGPDDVPRPRWIFRGCLPADHLDEVGQPHHDAPDPKTGFDHLRFYRNVARDLAELGF